MTARRVTAGVLAVSALLAGCQSTIPGDPSQTRCQISATDVGCEAQFTGSPAIDGVPANGVEVTAQGEVRWLIGNLGDPPVVVLDYRTYAAEGWTIVATETGTRFTNDRSSHGMFVSVERVDVF